MTDYNKDASVLVFYNNEIDNREYNISYDLSRTDITTIVEIMAAERLHDNLDRRGYNPKWPEYEPYLFPLCYRVDSPDAIDRLSHMFNIDNKEWIN